LTKFPVPMATKKGVKKMSVHKKNKIRNRLNRALEVPAEINFNIPKVTILKFEEMVIENYKGILEYQDFFIRIKTSIGIVNVNGFNLSLEEMTSDDLMVKGNIESVDFESVEDNREE